MRNIGMLIALLAVVATLTLGCRAARVIVPVAGGAAAGVIAANAIAGEDACDNLVNALTEWWEEAYDDLSATSTCEDDGERLSGSITVSRSIGSVDLTWHQLKRAPSATNYRIWQVRPVTRWYDYDGIPFICVYKRSASECRSVVPDGWEIVEE